MKTERVIQLLQIEKEYTLKQTGHQQQPINKEVRQALDIAIEAVNKMQRPASSDPDTNIIIAGNGQNYEVIHK